MKNSKLILGAGIIFAISGVAYADINDQIYLGNGSLNGIEYQVNSQSQTGKLTKVNTVVQQFTITTNGVCQGSSKTSTYPMQVVDANGKTLCSFNLQVTVSNHAAVAPNMAVAPNKSAHAVSTSCSTSSSYVTGKITSMTNTYPSIPNSTLTDYCSAKWIGTNESSGLYHGGQVMVQVVSKKQ